MDLNFQMFNKVKQALEAQNLLEVTTFTEQHVLYQFYPEIESMRINSCIQGQGLPSEVQKYMEIESLFNNENEFQHINFNTLFRKNDKFADFHNLQDVINNQKIDLIHNKGEVLIIYVWRGFSYVCQRNMVSNQKMMDKREDWRGKVRFVAINIDNNLQYVQEFFKSETSKNIQYITLGQKYGKSSIIKCLDIPNGQYVVLVDKNGIVQYLKSDVQENLQNMIDSLIKEEDLPNEQQKQEHNFFKKDQLGHSIGKEAYLKIRDNLKNASQKYPIKLSNCQIIQIVSKIWDKKQQIIHYGQLKIQYYVTQRQQIEAFKQIMKLIVQNVSQDCINLSKFSISNPEYLKESHTIVLENLADKYNVSKPFTKVLNYLRPLNESNWKPQKYLSFQPLKINNQISTEKLGQLLMEIQQYFKNVYIQSDSEILHIQKNSIPIALIGNPLFEIKNLVNVDTGLTQSLQLQKGKPQIITYSYAQQKDDYIEALVIAVKRSGTDAHITIISEKISPIVQKLKKANPTLITSYLRKGIRPAYFLFGVVNNRDMIVVDKNGIVVETRDVELTHLKYILNRPFEPNQKKNHKVPKQQIDQLYKFAQSDKMAKLRELARNLDYEFKFEIQYSQNTQTQQFYRPEAEIMIRKKDEEKFKDVIQGLKQFAAVKLYLIDTMVIPNVTGQPCQDCKKQLNFPYYYYHFSNTFRCVECGQKQNVQSEDVLKRYAINEYALLVFKQNSQVDIARFGFNFQPTSNLDALIPSFSCSDCMGLKGCRKQRFICMGCSRQPIKIQLNTSMCSDCFNEIRSGGPQVVEESRVMRYGHKLDHPVLRVNFMPMGMLYY